jgi:DinB superfamily
MAPHEMKDITGQLESARLELIAVVGDLTDEQARTRPAPGRWSVLECLEHVSFVERRFLGMVRESQPGTPGERDAAKESALEDRMRDRVNRRTAPDAVLPTGKYSSISEALRDFNGARDETIRFAAEEGENLVSRSAKHQILGVLNGVEALLLIAGHGRRHTEQMREAAEGR